MAIRADTLLQYQLVIDKYMLNGFKPKEAVQAVFPDKKDAAARAFFNRIMKDPECLAYYDEKRERALQKHDVDVKEVIGFLTNVIRVDILEMFNSDGTVKPLTEMSERARGCIQNIELQTKVSRDGRKRTLDYCKLVTYSKLEAAEKLMKYFGAYEADNSQKGSKTLLNKPVINLGYAKDRDKVLKEIEKSLEIMDVDAE